MQATINLTSQNSGMQKVNLDDTNEACFSQIFTHYCRPVWACLKRIFFGTSLFYSFQQFDQKLEIRRSIPRMQCYLMTLGMFYSNSKTTKVKGKGGKCYQKCTQIYLCSFPPAGKTQMLKTRQINQYTLTVLID